MPNLKSGVTSGPITITIPLNAAEVAQRGGTGTMTVTIANAQDPKVAPRILNVCDELAREKSATIAYS